MPQPLVLAIEPDLRQAAIVKRIVREKALADVVVVDSRDAAIQAMRTSMPDVLLLSALLSPRDEDELIAHLKTLEHAGHLQTHTIPQLASSLDAGDDTGSRGLFSAFRRKKDPAQVSGCDPDLFADEIRVYLQQAADKKLLLAQTSYTAQAHRPGPAVPSQAATADPEEPAAPESAWSSPFEWKPASSSRSSKSSEKPAAHKRGPAPAPAPAPAPVVTAPAAEAPSIIMPAIDEPIVRPAADVPIVEPAAFEPPIVKPAAAEPPPEPVAIQPPIAPTLEAFTSALAVPARADEPPAKAPRPVAAQTDTPAESAPPPAPAKKSARPADAPRPKAVADRLPKLTGRVHLQDLLQRSRPSDGSGRDRLGPLARWARSDAPRPVKGAAVTSDDVRSLISSLAVPSTVASVAYARGVRIRRVRVPVSPDQDAVQASA
ncbi:MAG TPA: hypothetical protein VFK57_25840 [Vicinamibacterales bacterium]|nr:hypothetical protein [Vicinamibacterales bacterium]